MSTGPFKRRKAVKKENSERWLLTYSDLITLLLALFIIMYAMSQIDQTKFAQLTASLQRAFNVNVLKGLDKSALGGENGSAAMLSEPPQIQTASDAAISLGTMGSDFARITAIMDKLRADQGLGNRISESVTREGILVRLEGNMIFAPAEAALQPNAGAVLDKLAAALRPIQNKVRVEGHTDDILPNVPAYPTNWDLSAARAVTVVRYLTEIAGLKPDRFSAVGLAEYDPVKSNDSRSGRAENRRVDVYILYPQRQDAAGTPQTVVKPDVLPQREGR